MVRVRTKTRVVPAIGVDTERGGDWTILCSWCSRQYSRVDPRTSATKRGSNRTDLCNWYRRQNSLVDACTSASPSTRHWLRLLVQNGEMNLPTVMNTHQPTRCWWYLVQYYVTANLDKFWLGSRCQNFKLPFVHIHGSKRCRQKQFFPSLFFILWIILRSTSFFEYFV